MKLYQLTSRTNSNTDIGVLYNNQFIGKQNKIYLSVINADDYYTLKEVEISPYNRTYLYFLDYVTDHLKICKDVLSNILLHYSIDEFLDSNPSSHEDYLDFIISVESFQSGKGYITNSFVNLLKELKANEDIIAKTMNKTKRTFLKQLEIDGETTIFLKWLLHSCFARYLERLYKDLFTYTSYPDPNPDPNPDPSTDYNPSPKSSTKIYFVILKIGSM